MEMSELTQRAMEIRHLYEVYELGKYGRAWTDEEIAMGFVGDVGDLMKLALAKKGVRDIPDVDERLAHELADCLWSVLVMAHKYGVDLEGAFLQTMDDIEARIT